MSEVELDQISPKTPQRFQWHSTAGMHTVTLIGSIHRENQPMAVHMQSSPFEHQQSASHPVTK